MSVVVVLGQQLEQPSIHPELRHRMESAIESYRRTDAEYLICTGGDSNSELSVPESRVMRRYAIDRGISADNVLVETMAKETIGNAYFSRKVIEDIQREVNEVVVVTSCYHSSRARYVFEQCFGEEYRIRSECAQVGINSSMMDEDLAFRLNVDFFEPVSKGEMAQIRERMQSELNDYYERIPGSIEV